MAKFKCKMCGEVLKIGENQSVVTCSYCGTNQTLEEFDSVQEVNLYDTGNHFRRNNDYDKTMAIYENILNTDSCEKVPIINRAQFTSVFADEDYKPATPYASSEQMEKNEQEAAELGCVEAKIDVDKFSENNQSKSVYQDSYEKAIESTKEIYVNVKKQDKKNWLKIFFITVAVLLVLNGLKLGIEKISDLKENNNQVLENQKVNSKNPYLWTFKMVESNNAEVVSEAQNSLGDIYANAIVLSGKQSTPYVSYYLGGEYERLVFNISCPDDCAGGDFRVIIDDKEDEPAYRTTVKRAMAVTTVDIDVTGAEFIKIVSGEGDDYFQYDGVILSDAILYVDSEDADVNDFKVDRVYEDVKLINMKMVSSNDVSVVEDAIDTKGNTYFRSVVLSGGYSTPYVTYYLAGEYKRLVFDVSCLEDSSIGDDTVILSIYGSNNSQKPIKQINVNRYNDVKHIEIDVSGIEFIKIEAGTGNSSSLYKGVILSNGMLYKE